MVMAAIRLAIFIAPTLVCCGCLARHIAHDGTHLREAMVDIYTDQVMDNLIRALQHAVRTNEVFEHTGK